MQHKTYNQDGLVNFAKMTQLAEMVTNVLQYQSMGFNFEPKPDVSQMDLLVVGAIANSVVPCREFVILQRPNCSPFMNKVYSTVDPH